MAGGGGTKVLREVEVDAAPDPESGGAIAALQASAAAAALSVASRLIFTSLRNARCLANLRAGRSGLVGPSRRAIRWLSSPFVLRPSPRRLGAAVLGAAGAAGLFVLLYAVAHHAYAPDSDGATVALEGFAMAHGRLLFHGWAISLDSFWTVDALWYLVASLLFGLHPVLMQAVPAAIAAAVIAFGVVIAVDERSRAAAVAAGATVVAILGLPSQALANFLLRGPLHVGTALWCLVAFLALRRGRFGWGFAVGIVFLAAGLLGDLQMLALGVVPVLVAGLAAMARRRDWRAGLAQVVAAVSSVVLAEVVRRIARAVGTFSIAKANPIATFSQMLHNLKHGLHEGALLMGVGSTYYGLGSEPKALSYVHVLAILVVFAAVAGTAIAFVWGALRGAPTVVGTSSEAAWRLDDMLLLAALASPVAFVVLAASPDPEYARYLTPGVIFGAVLAGRVVGRVAEDFEWRGLGRAAAAIGLAATCCYAAGVAVNLDRPAPVASAVPLASWLESHHLRHGVGAYWSASVVTVESSGRVEVRPVVSPNGRVLIRYDRNSASSWYTRPFHFLVFNLTAPWGDVNWKTGIATFGQPTRAYTVDGIYRVMVWNKAIRISPNVPGG